MLGACLRRVLEMDINTTRAPKGPSAALNVSKSHESWQTKYYFAYGSNLHIKQMKKRCPNSRYIGRARLSNHRWQINERGYANIIGADGHNVHGLVFEIDCKDEARLDINEGVPKNAYQKRYMSVFLHRAQGLLYRRPVSWIIDKGGLAAVCRRIPEASGPLIPDSPRQLWESDVLVYISLNHVQDGTPKDEYVNRLNLGIVDARALGVDEAYISKSIRPFIPDAAPNNPQAASFIGRDEQAQAGGSQRQAEHTSGTGETSAAQKGQVRNPSDERNAHRSLANIPRIASCDYVGHRARTALAPLRSRVIRDHDAPGINVEDFVAD